MTVETKPLKQPGIWTPSQIFLAALFVSPIGGCYLLSQNAKNFGKEKLAKKIFRVGIYSTLGLIAISLFFLVFVKNFPFSIFAFIFASAIHEYTKSTQKPLIKEWTEKGGAKNSYWKLLKTAAIIFIIQLPIYFSMGALSVILESLLKSVTAILPL